jgi:hypothetical protein
MSKRKPDDDPSDDKRTTNEKPLHIPLDFEDALEALLNVSPPTDEKPDKVSKSRKKKAEAGD